MTENLSTHESGTPFSNGDQLDVHAGNPDLISLDELEHRRRREAFEREALRSVIASPEQRPLSPSERLGRLNTVSLRRRHIEKLNQGGFDQAA